ncbi:glycosyltransferase, partial [PVC group bacterium]|nr:glycosyltransferase [PVC group bacterium]
GTSAYKRLEIQKRYANVIPVFWGRGELFNVFKESGKFDVVTVQDPFWRGLVGLCVSLYKRARLNVQLHTDLSSQNWLRRFVAWIVLHHADSVRVVSSKLKTQVAQIGVKAPIKVLPIFLDIECFKSFSRKESHELKKKIFWVGRFEKEKDPALAIDILNEVRDRGIDAELIMLGSGSLDDELQKKKKDLPVKFLGWQDPAGFLVDADVLLNTSFYEGYGVAIVEALAMRVPVVAPDVGIAREAGAVIVNRDELASSVKKVLKSNMRGELKITILSENEWGKQWVETLLNN